MKVDMHIHTLNSDGELFYYELFKISKEKQIDIISITDHDYISDYYKYAFEFGIKYLNGIEFSTYDKGMHILGYNITNLEKVKNKLDELLKYNNDICIELIELLNKKGFDIDTNYIVELYDNLNIEHRFINKKMIVKGLIEKQYASSVKEAYDNIIGRNAKYYIPIKKLTHEEVINLILESGGIPVLAHPSTIQDSLDSTIKQLVDEGLLGVEILNLKQNISSEDIKTIKKYKLIETFGSDYHSKNDELGVNISDEKIKILYKNFNIRG